jgi:hypothetical protein
MTTPRDVLIAYSQEQAASEQVWRALTEHSGWYVPADFAVKRLGTTDVQKAMVFAPEVPRADHDLFLFTDPVAAARAEGAPIGVFASEFSGVRIFQALNESYSGVRVNPHSPKNEGWYFPQDTFVLAKLWAQVVHLEQAIGNAPGGSVPYAELAAHPGFMVLINSERLPITLNMAQPPGSYAVAFTSPDRFQAFVSKQPAEQHPHLKSATLDGVALCRTLQQFEVAGVAIYYRDQTSMVLRRDQFDAVIQAVS